MKPPSGIPFSLVLKQINVFNEIENICLKHFVPARICFHPRGEPRMKPPSAISFFLLLKQICFLLKIENTCFKAFRAGPDLLPS